MGERSERDPEPAAEARERMTIAIAKRKKTQMGRHPRVEVYLDDLALLLGANEKLLADAVAHAKRILGYSA